VRLVKPGVGRATLAGAFIDALFTPLLKTFQFRSCLPGRSGKNFDRRASHLKEED
jgi:hypothetical protein